ncbi:unnamed protein product [Rotaria socialis]|uniref:ZP domain-containing protein n=1 Tax=Rotaria socialis TaxID=392032 RepID=A0A820EGV9_9BILA|nr:unnamed protein product [Rotaria socialis]CAF3471568.1 unnamed protein product [Rotaria socialis]CAF4248457.1 unnamed protein product [Rotaria socialis]CAF4336599.1 unnamed protein product [Rotaria socialis]
MYSSYYLISIGMLWSLSMIDAKQRGQSQRNLGDFCIPGTCASLNSNCKRVGETAFRCVCKDQYLSVNKTHCVKVINASSDSSCIACIERGGICLDEDSDNRMDTCFCQLDTDLCNERTTLSMISTTESTEKLVPIVTPLLPSRSVRQGELTLSLHDISQRRLIDNGGSVLIGDRLVIEIKYRTAEQNPDRHQIIAENCSISSSVSDNEIRLEKIPLLTNRCPSLDSRLPVRFQRIDPDHIKSSIFQMHKFDTTSIVYLRCSIAICYGQIENCQERLCPEIRRSPTLHRGQTSIFNLSLTSTVDYAPFDYVDEDGASVIALRRRRKRDDSDGEQTKRNLARLLSDLSWSMDHTSSNKLVDESNSGGHYEIRQVQQQIIIELPLPQPAEKIKIAYEAFYGRTSSSATQSSVERSTVIATISIIFIIGISISLFVVYRACYFDYAQRIYGSASFAGFGNGADSTYAGIRSSSQVCRYDMGRRSEQRFDESLFVTNVEPIGAYRRQC